MALGTWVTGRRISRGMVACFALCAISFARAATPNYASLLVADLSTGTTLVSESADTPRYPASLTKLMTLYVLFEKLDGGSVHLDQEFQVSENAAAQPPTKVGLKAGGALSVEECIEALIVKSANDAAVVVAEGLGGDEASFAGMMTETARQLGMDRTEFRNASGLPDPGQVTTSRDLSLLVTALVGKFPQYYHYFALRSAKVANKTLLTHNNFLYEFPGAEGMKTGYTRDAGYNLVATAQRNGHRLVGIILGAAGPARRDAAMVSAMQNAFNRLGLAPAPQTKAAAKAAPKKADKPILRAAAKPSKRKPVAVSRSAVRRRSAASSRS